MQNPRVEEAQEKMYITENSANYAFDNSDEERHCKNTCTLL